MGGKLVPESQFEFFSLYHHFKVCKLDNSAVNLLRFKGDIRFQTKERWWSSKIARVVNDDGASENYMGQQFLHKLICPVACLTAQDAGCMIVEMAINNAEEGIEKSQWVKLKLQLGVSCVHKAEYTVYDIKGFNIMLGKRWMHDTNRWYQTNHDSNLMSIANHLWEEREEGRVHIVPSIHHLDINKKIVQQANFEIGMDPLGKILSGSQCSISPWEEDELWRQINKPICCSSIQPFGSNFSSPG